MRILFSLLFLQVVFFLQTSQTQTAGRYYFTHYTTASGLVSNELNTIAQDADGYIWTGTNDGLQRFDGTRFKTFRHAVGDATTIPTSQVWQLMPDTKKNLWLLTAEGGPGELKTTPLSMIFPFLPGYPFQ